MGTVIPFRFPKGNIDFRRLCRPQETIGVVSVVQRDLAKAGLEFLITFENGIEITLDLSPMKDRIANLRWNELVAYLIKEAWLTAYSDQLQKAPR